MKRPAAPLLVLLLCLLFCRACAPHGEKATDSQAQALEQFEAFSRQTGDSITAHPGKIYRQALLRMEQETDSLVWHYYATIAMKAQFFLFHPDSVVYYFERGKRFFERQPPSPLTADLASEHYNTMGNLYARLGNIDTAACFFQEAYRQCLQGRRLNDAPDILMNLADVRGRQGRYDHGAYWYRRALLLCDSLELPHKKTAVYYGLGQIYMALRSFKLCDQYFDLAGERYADMLPYEQYIYLNNRGNSYYYREDYPQAMHYFRRCCDLVDRHPDLTFERNLCYLNMSDIFLKTGQPDSSEIYLKRCRPFFEKTHSVQALYYIETQELELALHRNDLEQVQRILSNAISIPQLEPDMALIRNASLQRYYEATGNYKEAYSCQKRRTHIADSLRGERVRMQVADATIRYRQDSTQLVHNIQMQQKENEVATLRQTSLLWVALCITAFLATGFLYLYSQKKRALLLAQSQRIVTSLRMENIRNRLSPHFIFNILNREMAGLQAEKRQELALLVKVMRRNLELAERPYITLEEELDFVQNYLTLERSSLGDRFRLNIRIDEKVRPKEVPLPSMMIQIPVENAVKHGLREKEGERLLRIDVEQADGHGISIRITDNGGGYRPDSQHRGTGMGMKVIMQTIQLLNSRNKEHIEASVHNVTLPGGETGCEVCFFLPDNYNFQL